MFFMIWMPYSALDRSEDANSDDGDSDRGREDDVMDRAGNDTEREDSATDVVGNDTLFGYSLLQ